MDEMVETISPAPANQPADITLHLLGGFLLENNPSLTLAHAPRLQSLLAYLVLHCRTPQPRSRVAFALWPESSDAQAHTSLRRALYRLRRAWPPLDQFLQATQSTMHWTAAAPLTVDVLAFCAALDQAETAADLAAALDWYQGPLLPDCDDEWVIIERERLHQQWLAGMVRLAEQYAAEQQYALAVAVAEEVRRHAPLNEAHYQRLMRLHMQAGNRSAALDSFHACAAMLADEFHTRPASATQELYATISRAPAVSEVGPALPAQPTPLVGRTAELATLHRLLDQPDCRLLTLLGPGGIGKTRLALQVAAQRQAQYAHGVVFVPLATATTPDDLLLALIQALRLPLYAQASPWEIVVNYLRRRTLLLLLDAFEHVPHAAPLVSDLLAAVPQLTLLVTSREALHIQWEQRFPLAGLPVPDAVTPSAPTTDEPATSDAVALFQQQATRIVPGFAPTAEDAAAIATICRMVGGLPLGIVIAAALIDTMNCPRIAHTLQQRMFAVESRLQDLAPAHRSLYAVIASSWERLTPDAQRCYRRLAPFQGSFTSEAARAVAAASPAHLQRFVDISLLRQVAPERYQLHEIVQQFAAQHLANAGEHERVLAAHSGYYLTLLYRQDGNLRGPRPRPALALIEAAYSDIRVAWQWALLHQAWSELLNAIQSLSDFYEFRGWIQVGHDHLQQTVAELRTAMPTQCSPDGLLWRLMARVATRLAWFLVYRGDLAAAEALMQEGMQVAGMSQADWELALTQHFLGHVLVWRGQVQAALPHLAASQATFTRLNDRWYAGEVDSSYGEVALLRGEYAQAAQHYATFVEHLEAINDVRTLGSGLLLLGRARFLEGDMAATQAAFQRGLALAREVDDPLVVSSCLVGLGLVATAQGEVATAWPYFRESVTLARDIAVTLVLLHAAIGVAHLLAHGGDIFQAIELLRLVVVHPACDEEPRRRAQALLDTLLAALAPAERAQLLTTPPACPFDELLSTLLEGSIPA
jgi:predicted ATPase/DNA-binding SARP family transcriptional activator